jgi:hypothetical protein
VWAELPSPINVHDWARTARLIDQPYERAGGLALIGRHKRKFEISTENRRGIEARRETPTSSARQ